MSNTAALPCGRSIDSTGLRGLALRMVAMAGVAVWAVGCGPPPQDKAPTPIADWAAFQREVLQSSQPVLIEFNKDPCPPCATQQRELAKLTGEFDGRIRFLSMTLMRGEFLILCPEVHDRYHIFWVPTTILFVAGQERKRWENVHDAPEIREELKRVLLETAVPQASADPAGGGSK